MRTVSIKLNDMAIANIQLGFVGENNTTQVIFNCKEIFENNPNAVQSLTVTPPEGEAYPAVTTRVGDTVVWTVSSSDTAYDGEGNVQLTFTDGSEVIKTYNAKTTILESATPGGTAPDPVQNWIDQAEAVLESLDGLTVEAETLEPGSSATAEVSEDPDDGHRHIDFGIPQGEKGDIGETPSFSIGTVTTGAAGSDASASITGTDEEPVLNLTIPQGLKGDAGNGDMLAPAYSTSATYKAGKYVTYNGGLYCCISDISTAESWTAAHWRSTDFGKDTSALKSAINTLCMCKIPLESGGWSSDGNTKSVMVSRLRNVYPISREVFKSITLPQGYSASGYTLDETYTKLGTLSYSNSHDLSGMAQDVKYINLSIRKDDSASSNISSYCDTVQSGTVAVLIDSYNISALQTGVSDLQTGALQYRGSISDLGYTSVAQCTKTGFYDFLSSDVASLSDLPTGWTSGGYILVYKLPNGAWQYIGNNRNRYIRSGLSGVWYPDVMVDTTLTKANVAADAKATGDVFRYLNVLKRRKLVYNVASYTKSNARLRIYIPQESGYLLIDMRHYYYDNATGKADCWGIDNAFACNDARTNLFQITNGGEWECAVRVKDGQDFSGGGTHGDEYNAVTTFFIDGMPVDITTYTSVTDFKELKIIQESELYTPTENGNQTKIATHGTEWIFNENGIKISQCLKWEPSVNIAIAYMCMFPVAKTSSYNDGTIKIVDRIFTDTGYDVYTPTNNTSKRWQGASVVDAYCTESKVHCKISPIEYVKNLTGGNVVSETDNGGLNYFKLYWPVVNSGDYTVTGHTTESGELWKSVVEYSISLT